LVGTRCPSTFVGVGFNVCFCTSRGGKHARGVDERGGNLNEESRSLSRSGLRQLEGVTQRWLERGVRAPDASDRHCNNQEQRPQSTHAQDDEALQPTKTWRKKPPRRLECRMPVLRPVGADHT
jgi:hypothetical protein